MSSAATLELPRRVTIPHPRRECLRVVRLSSDRRAAWSDYVANRPDATLFHDLPWRDAVCRAFDHEEVYQLALCEERVVGVLPMFQVNSRIAGRMLVSVPYGVGGGILADNEEIAQLLGENARELALDRGCGAIDLRGGDAALARFQTVDSYVGFQRELPSKAEDVLGWLPRKARAAARNARSKYGLEVVFGGEQLRQVWELYARSMRRLGSITYPFRFFESLCEAAPDHHWTCMVRWQGRPVAGLVTFLFRDKVMPYFVGLTDEARRCSAAHFIYLTTMERGVEEGYRIYDFGRSRRDNPGSYDFKRFHGFEPRPLHYQCWSLCGTNHETLAPSRPAFAAARRALTYSPLWLTKWAGELLSRHIPG